MSTKRASGFTLVEVIVFIVVVGIALAAVFSAFNAMTAASADPQVRKQVLAIAESLMEEVQLMPFTYCDPNDANAATAASPAGCSAPSEDAVIGPEVGETRYSATDRFDNVSDYNGFALASGIRDLNDNAVSGLAGYTASVTVSSATLGPAADVTASGDALRISVTVTGPGSFSTTLEGYRARYAPNSVP